MKAIAIGFHLLGGLGVFLYGLKVMSEGLQKVASHRLRDILSTATKNPFKATISGFLVTCAVQSSSATTVMVVGFCSAGLLTLYQSLGIIFGANIGTTTTGWLISLLGFKVMTVLFHLFEGLVYSLLFSSKPVFDNFFVNEEDCMQPWSIFRAILIRPVALIPPTTALSSYTDDWGYRSTNVEGV